MDTIGIGQHIKYIDEKLNQLKKNKRWSISEFKKTDILSTMINILTDWNSRINDAEIQKGLMELFEKIRHIENDRGDRYALLDEMSYRKKFKQKTGDTLKRIDKGDKDAIFRLLKYGDISFLFGYPIMLQILKAGVEEDQTFFKNLANALKDRREYKHKVKGKHNFIRKICFDRALNGLIDFDKTSDVRGFYSELVDDFEKQKVSLENIDVEKRTKKNKSDLENINSILEEVLNDEKYFIHKWLVRQGLRKKRATKKLT